MGWNEQVFVSIETAKAYTVVEGGSSTKIQQQPSHRENAFNSNLCNENACSWTSPKNKRRRTVVLMFLVGFVTTSYMMYSNTKTTSSFLLLLKKTDDSSVLEPAPSSKVNQTHDAGANPSNDTAVSISSPSASNKRGETTAPKTMGQNPPFDSGDTTRKRSGNHPKRATKQEKPVEEVAPAPIKTTKNKVDKEKQGGLTAEEREQLWYRRLYFSCNTTIPRLEALQRQLGLRSSKNELLKQAELLSAANSAEKSVAPRQVKQSGDAVEILLTDFGWLNPNITISDQEPRTIWSTLMLESIQNHPFYNPTGWAELQQLAQHDSQHTTNRRRIATVKNTTSYVFLDVETFGVVQWPTYGLGGSGGNMESCRHGKSSKRMRRKLEPFQNPNSCDLVRRVLSTPIFRNQFTDSKVVVFHFHSSCLDDMEPELRDKIVLVDLSTRPSKLNLGVDMGMPPLAPKPALLTTQEIDEIQSCQANIYNDDNTNSTMSSRRRFLFTFKGTIRQRIAPVRQALLELERDDVLTERTGGSEAWARYNLTFRDLLVQSQFVGAPRGDRLFSFRFAEILSAGAIPVVYADGWVLPYTPELVHWNEYMVVIPENRAHETLKILDGISLQRRCEMRNKGWEIYNKYMKGTSEILQGVLDVLEIRRRQSPRKRLSSPFDYTPYRECFTGRETPPQLRKCLAMEQPRYDFNKD